MTWTKKEIEYYIKKIKRPNLGPLFAQAKIPSNNPQKRLEYLTELLDIQTKNPEKIFEIAKKNDSSTAFIFQLNKENKNKISKKIMAINYLEEQVLKKYY